MKIIATSTFLQAKALFLRNHLYAYEGMRLKFIWHFVMPCLPVILYNALNYLGIFASTGDGVPRALIISFGITFYLVFSESIVGCTNCLELNKSYINKTGLDIIPCYVSIVFAVLMSFSIRFLALLVALIFYAEYYTFNLLYAPILALSIIIFGVSIGSMLSIFATFYRDLTNFVQMMAFYLLFASGVFGFIDATTTIGKFVTVLPSYIYVTFSRSVVLGYQEINSSGFIYLAIISFVLFVFAMYLQRNAKSIILNHLK